MSANECSALFEQIKPHSRGSVIYRSATFASYALWPSSGCASKGKWYANNEIPFYIKIYIFYANAPVMLNYPLIKKPWCTNIASAFYSAAILNKSNDYETENIIFFTGVSREATPYTYNPFTA